MDKVDEMKGCEMVNSKFIQLYQKARELEGRELSKINKLRIEGTNNKIYFIEIIIPTIYFKLK